MAGPSVAEQLRAEASCPVCLELFRDPVSVPCGHNFCRGCIERCWERSRGSFSCPRCRNAAPERALLCLVCGHSRAHRLHRLVPAEEAAQEFKEQIQTRLQALKEEREKYLESRKSGGRRSSHLDKTRSERERMAREFRELRRLLEERERLLLAQLGDLDRALGRAQDEALAKVSEELSQLDTLIWEMEGKFQLPPSQFLQDIRQLLDSCETMKFQPPAEISPNLERRLRDFVQRNDLVRGTLRRCQDSLMFQLQEPADVTLDPRTAHPNLQLSADGKQARGRLVPGDVPDAPERFDFEPCVLARGGFTRGRHFWEVEVGRGGVWAVGAVREKGRLSLGPQGGIWGLEKWGGQLRALTARKVTPVAARGLPRRVGVHLDYGGGTGAVFDAGDGGVLFAFSRVAFAGERVRPWLWVVGARSQ
ncbi:TRI27 protein, partial [Ptilonorhynchus violaceus]|nr:TRI27 protein [Ptilonorhynchus violaceus]